MCIIFVYIITFINPVTLSRVNDSFLNSGNYDYQSIYKNGIKVTMIFTQQNS